MMKNNKDPKWISQADRIYGGFLYLFPSAHRKEFGPWMRQAFRDRCREVARGEQSIFRILAAEIVPDLLLGAGREHVTSNFGEINRKHMVALSLLGCLSLWALFHEPINKQLFDLAEASQRKAKEIKDNYRFKKYQSRLQEMSEWLVKEDGSPKAKALSAYLKMYIDDKKSVALIRQVESEHADIRTFAIAELACSRVKNCEISELVSELTQQAPQNAYVWLRALNVAISNKDEIGERYAIKKIAESSYVESYVAGIENELINLADKFSPNDKDMPGYLDLHFSDDLPSSSIFSIPKSLCGRLRAESIDSELLNDCRKIAVLFGKSDDLTTAGVMGKMSYRLSATQLERQNAYQSIRDYRWWQDAYYMVPDKNNRESWRKWSEVWRGKRMSIVAIQSVLKSRGMPINAPADYELSEYDKQAFGILAENHNEDFTDELVEHKN